MKNFCNNELRTDWHAAYMDASGLDMQNDDEDIYNVMIENNRKYKFQINYKL